MSHQAAKRVYAELAQRPGDGPSAVAERLGLVQVSDQGALGGWVDEVLAAHPGGGRALPGGEAKLMGFFVGPGDEAEQGEGGSEGRAAGAAGEAGVGTASRRRPDGSATGACEVRMPPARSGRRLALPNGGSAAAQERHRVHRDRAVSRDPVEVRARRPAAPPDRADQLARRDRVAGGDVHPAQVEVAGDQPAAVVEVDRVARQIEIAPPAPRRPGPAPAPARRPPRRSRCRDAGW